MNYWSICGETILDNRPEDDGGKKKGKRGSGPKTVTSVYLVHLGELMHTLHNAEPHPIRCLVPNTHKQPGMVGPPFIMPQLTCNGVLGVSESV